MAPIARPEAGLTPVELRAIANESGFPDAALTIDGDCHISLQISATAN